MSPKATAAGTNRILPATSKGPFPVSAAPAPSISWPTTESIADRHRSPVGAAAGNIGIFLIL